MDLLFIILGFLITIGILVAVHEFGHYWVACKVGVKVLRFSIGMGPIIWSKKSGADQTEYALSAFPIGGYVAMLGENGEEVPEAERARAFRAQPVWKRFAIVLAGPAFNLILAVLVYWLMFMWGVPAIKPYVEAAPNSLVAMAGIQSGDLITAIDGQEVTTLKDARMLLLEEYLKTRNITVTVKTQQGSFAERRLDLSNTSFFKDESDYFDDIGFRAWSPKFEVIVPQVVPNSPAEKAGIRANDQVLTVDDEAVRRGEEVSHLIANSNGKPVQLRLLRGNQTLNVVVTPEQKDNAGKPVWRVGIVLAEHVPEDARNMLEFQQRFGLIDALVQGWDETRRMTVMSLKLMGKLVTGEVSLSNVSGPITIARYAGDAVRSGLAYFLSFLAVISISLGILNLLPIPMLDGGHLLYYIIEMIKGSPVSQRVEAVGQNIGLALIGSLMVLAFVNDIMRLIK